MNKQVSKVWTFSSDSNPNIEYETLQWSFDGALTGNGIGGTLSRRWDLTTENDGHCAQQPNPSSRITLL
jgi:hypothetical protein